MPLFASEYQGGLYFEVFSPQGSNPLANWKASPGIKKEYDRTVKGYVLEILGSGFGCKLQLPNEKLKTMCLLQPVLVLQVFVPEGPSFAFEIAIVDKGGTRRRIVFSTAFQEVKLTPLHCQIPLAALPRNIWMNLAVDISGMVEGCFVGNQYRSTELLIISTSCKLRRVFTMKQAPPDYDGLEEGAFDVVMPVPRPLDFPMGVENRNKVLTFQRLVSSGLVGFRPMSQGIGAGGHLTARGRAAMTGPLPHDEVVLAFGSRIPSGIPPSAGSPVKKGGQRRAAGPPGSNQDPYDDIEDPQSRPESVNMIPRSNSALGSALMPSRTARIPSSREAGTPLYGGRDDSSIPSSNSGRGPTKLQQRKPRMDPVDTAQGPSTAYGASPRSRANGSAGLPGAGGPVASLSPKNRKDGLTPSNSSQPQFTWLGGNQGGAKPPAATANGGWGAHVDSPTELSAPINATRSNAGPRNFGGGHPHQQPGSAGSSFLLASSPAARGAFGLGAHDDEASLSVQGGGYNSRNYADAPKAEISTAWEDLPLSRQPAGIPKPPTGSSSNRPQLLYSNRDASANPVAIELWASSARAPPPGRPPAPSTVLRSAAALPIAPGASGALTARDMSLRDAAAYNAANGVQVAASSSSTALQLDSMRASAPVSVNVLRQISARPVHALHGPSPTSSLLQQFGNGGAGSDHSSYRHTEHEAGDWTSEDDFLNDEVEDADDVPLSHGGAGGTFDFTADPRPNRMAGRGRGAGLYPIPSVNNSFATSGVESSLDSGIHSTFNSTHVRDVSALDTSVASTRSGVGAGAAATSPDKRKTRAKVALRPANAKGAKASSSSKPPSNHGPGSPPKERASTAAAAIHAARQGGFPRVSSNNDLSLRVQSLADDVPEEIVPDDHQQMVQHPILASIPLTAGGTLRAAASASLAAISSALGAPSTPVGASQSQRDVSFADEPDSPTNTTSPSLNLKRSASFSLDGKSSFRDKLSTERGGGASGTFEATFSVAAAPLSLANVEAVGREHDTRPSSSSTSLRPGTRTSRLSETPSEEIWPSSITPPRPPPNASLAAALANSSGVASPSGSDRPSLIPTPIATKTPAEAGKPSAAARLAKAAYRTSVTDEIEEELHQLSAPPTPVIAPLGAEPSLPQLPQDGGASPPQPSSRQGARPPSIGVPNPASATTAFDPRPYSAAATEYRSSTQSQAWDLLLDDNRGRPSLTSGLSSPRSGAESRRISDLDGIGMDPFQNPVRTPKPPQNKGFDDGVLWSFENSDPKHRLYTPPVVPASKIGDSSPDRVPHRLPGAQPPAGPEVFVNSMPSNLKGGETDPLSVIGVEGRTSQAMLDLVYDPILNCYYDAKTNQYFTLR